MLRTNSSRVAASGDAVPKLTADPPDTFVSFANCSRSSIVGVAVGVGVGVAALSSEESELAIVGLTGVLSRLSSASPPSSPSLSVSVSVSASV